MVKVLLFNITDTKRMKILFLLMQHGITAVEVAEKDFSRSLGSLLGLSGHAAAPEAAAPFVDEMLVLHDLSAEQFHGLLNGMQALQAPVTYKAVTTEHNLSWTPIRLCRELAAEHAAMQNR